MIYSIKEYELILFNKNLFCKIVFNIKDMYDIIKF